MVPSLWHSYWRSDQLLHQPEVFFRCLPVWIRKCLNIHTWWHWRWQVWSFHQSYRCRWLCHFYQPFQQRGRSRILVLIRDRRQLNPQQFVYWKLDCRNRVQDWLIRIYRYRLEYNRFLKLLWTFRIHCNCLDNSIVPWQYQYILLSLCFWFLSLFKFPLFLGF